MRHSASYDFMKLNFINLMKLSFKIKLIRNVLPKTISLTTYNLPYMYIFILKGRVITKTVLQNLEVLISSGVFSKYSYLYMHMECINSK